MAIQEVSRSMYSSQNLPVLPSEALTSIFYHLSDVKDWRSVTLTSTGFQRLLPVAIKQRLQDIQTIAFKELLMYRRFLFSNEPVPKVPAALTKSIATMEEYHLKTFLLRCKNLKTLDLRGDPQALAGVLGFDRYGERVRETSPHNMGTIYNLIKKLPDQPPFIRVQVDDSPRCSSVQEIILEDKESYRLRENNTPGLFFLAKFFPNITKLTLINYYALASGEDFLEYKHLQQLEFKQHCTALNLSKFFEKRTLKLVHVPYSWLMDHPSTSNTKRVVDCWLKLPGKIETLRISIQPASLGEEEKKRIRDEYAHMQVEFVEDLTTEPVKEYSENW